MSTTQWVQDKRFDFFDKKDKMFDCYKKIPTLLVPHWHKPFTWLLEDKGSRVQGLVGERRRGERKEKKRYFKIPPFFIYLRL